MLATSLRHARPLPPMIPLMERLAILRLQLNRQHQQEHGSDEEYQSVIPLTWESVQVSCPITFSPVGICLQLVRTERAIGHLCDGDGGDGVSDPHHRSHVPDRSNTRGRAQL